MIIEFIPEDEIERREKRCAKCNNSSSGYCWFESEFVTDIAECKLEVIDHE